MIRIVKEFRLVKSNRNFTGAAGEKVAMVPATGVLKIEGNEDDGGRYDKLTFSCNVDKDNNKFGGFSDYYKVRLVMCDGFTMEEFGTEFLPVRFKTINDGNTYKLSTEYIRP